MRKGIRHTSFTFPRCPMRKTFPATLLRPTPRLRLYFLYAIFTMSPLSIHEGTTTAVTVSLFHWGFFVQRVRPHALTACLPIDRNGRELATQSYQTSSGFGAKPLAHNHEGAELRTWWLQRGDSGAQSRCRGPLRAGSCRERLADRRASGWTGCRASRFRPCKT